MEYKVINNETLSANITSSAMDVDGLPNRPRTLGVHIVTNNLNAVDATVVIQHSNINEDAYFSDIPSASVTLDDGGGDNNDILTPFVDVGMKYYRAKVTKNTVTSGEITVSFNFN